jgi:voltage-gated sodium channel
MQIELPEASVAASGTALRDLLESRGFTLFITAVILINAVTLGLETSASVVAATGPLLRLLDTLALGIFVCEISLKLWVYRHRFFTDGWNVFDFTIVAIALVPASGPLAVLRALRVLRVLRLISIVPQLRVVVGALLNSLPGMAAVLAVLMLLFYIAAVMSTTLFGAAFPDWFGSIGESMYTLFQIMTLESWSMGIVRPVMEVYPFAWVFFVPFVIITSFAVLNLFIALIVNSIQMIHMQDRESAETAEDTAHNEREQLLQEVRALRKDLKTITGPAAGN